MPTPLLSDACAIEALNAVLRHGGVTKAADALKMSRGTLHSRVQIAKARGLTGTPPRAADAPPPVEPSGAYEEMWQRFRGYIGMVEDRYDGPCPRPVDPKRFRVTAAGDFHCPYHSPRALAELIAAERDRTDVLVMGGDFNDAPTASRFIPSRYTNFREEWAAMTMVMEQLSQAFPRIIYLRRSNHADRYEKRIREHNPPDIVEAILAMTGGLLSPDIALVQRFPNVEVANWTNGQHTADWLCVIGDVAFSHAQKSSAIPAKAPRDAHDWLVKFRGLLSLPQLTSVVQFHTHAQSAVPWGSDCVVLEPGAMCEVPDYMMSDRAVGTPQRTGYCTMEFVNDRVDVNSIRNRWLDWEWRHVQSA